jgi:hypothetical protein
VSPAGLGFRVWSVTSRNIYIYIYIYNVLYIYFRAGLPSQAPRGGLASQTGTCMGTLRPEDGYNVSRNMSPMQCFLVNIRHVVFDSI